MNRFLLTSLIGLTWTVVASCQAWAGGIEYPAGGNFDPAEGTVEIWFTPMAKELNPPDDGQYHNVFDLFSIAVPEHWKINASWFRHKAQVGPKVSMKSEKVANGLASLMAPTKTVFNWNKGEMHHFAFAWKGKAMVMLVDGVRLTDDELQGTALDARVAGSVLGFGTVGSKSDQDCRIILHAIRVSSIQKDSGSLKDAQPEPEISTLLLDRFDTALAGDKTRPVVIYTLDAPDGGKLVGKVRFVTTPRPGLALYGKE